MAKKIATNPILSLLASSAGASGLLVVVGFFIQQGIRSIIGVSARRSLDVTSYLIDVAYFAEDTLGVIVEHGKAIVLGIVVIVAVGAAAYWLARRIKKPVPDVVRTRSVLFAVLMLVFVVKLLYVDWAVISISDFFRKPVIESRDFGPDFLTQRTKSMWLDLLRAHDADKHIHSTGRGELEDAYAFYVLFSALIAGACLALLRKKRDDGYASVAVVVAIMQLLLTAYAYGKFQRSTFYPCVALSLREPASPPTQNAIMMSEDGESVTLFNAADDRFHRISWSEIREITLLGEEDVLGAHILAVPPALTGDARQKALDRNAQLKKDGRLPRCLD